MKELLEPRLVEPSLYSGSNVTKTFRTKEVSAQVFFGCAIAPYLSPTYGIRVVARASLNTLFAQWSLMVLEPREWLVAELVKGDPGASGADGGTSEKFPDAGERGECGDE